MNNVYHRILTKPRVPLAVVIVLACGAQLMVVVDGLIVTVALPQMRSGLNLTASEQQWIVSGYLIAFGGLLLLAARAADLIGHRRVFLLGVAVFTLASLVGGIANDAPTLLVARVVQGAGAAALAPSSLSLLTMTHTGERRALALSIWSATSASAAALGLVLGGVITSGLGWRWVLLVNVPIGVVLWVMAVASLTPSRSQKRPTLDVPGATIVTLGAGALTYGISQASRHGWGDTPVIVPILAAAALLTLFVFVEHRSPEPLVPLSFLRRHNIIAANMIVAGLGAVMTATLYFLCLYQQAVLGYSPIQTGLALVPMSVVLAAGAIASKSLLNRFGTRRLMVTGSLTMAAGLAWLATLSEQDNYVLHLFGPTLLWAAGASIVTVPCVTLATTGIDAQHAGLASGIVNAARQIGGAMGLAVLVALASAVTALDADANHAIDGFGIAMLGASGIAVLIAIVALTARPREELHA